MKIDRLEGKTVVVTGAASGIGLATVRALCARGARAAICDVDEKNLARVAGELRGQDRLLVSEVVDVARRADVSRFADAVHRLVPVVDVLVNNAGIAVGGRFLDVPLDEWDRVVGINLCGVAYGCHAFLPRMIDAQRGGHIVNIASMAGYAATPGLTSYHATKFGVVGFSESLRLELADQGIGVTAVCPGFINTPITTTSRMYGLANKDEVRGRLVKLFDDHGRPPERVADAILRAIARDRPIAPVTAEAHVFYWLKRLSPWTVERIGRALAREVDRSITSEQ